MVIGSNPIRSSVAAVAQLVEHNLAKVRVAGSNPVCRSICDNSSIGRASSFQVGGCRFESCLSLNGSLVELGTILHCHCKGHGFDSHTNRDELEILRVFGPRLKQWTRWIRTS